MVPAHASGVTAGMITGRPRIVVGVDRDFPPYSFVDAQGRIAGFTIDLTLASGEVKNYTYSGIFKDMAAIGAQVGAKVSHKTPRKVLRSILAAIIAATAVKIWYELLFR